MGYFFSFHHANKVELAIGGGVHITDIGIGLNLLATASGGAVPRDFDRSADLSTTAPVPYISFLIRYEISPRWSFSWKYDALRLSFNNINGVMIDSLGIVEHRTFKHVGFGLGYNSFRITIDGESSSSLYQLNSSYDGILFYGKGYF